MYISLSLRLLLSALLLLVLLLLVLHTAFQHLSPLSKPAPVTLLLTQKVL